MEKHFKEIISFASYRLAWKSNFPMSEHGKSNVPLSAHVVGKSPRSLKSIPNTYRYRKRITFSNYSFRPAIKSSNFPTKRFYRGSKVNGALLIRIILENVESHCLTCQWELLLFKAILVIMTHTLNLLLGIRKERLRQFDRWY